MGTTYNSSHCFDIVDIGHSKLQNNTTGHRTFEFFIGFLSSETLKMPSMMCNNLFKSSQLHRWSRNSLCLWILNAHWHIHKPLSLNLKSYQVKIYLNTTVVPMLTSLNWHPLLGFMTKFCLHLPFSCHQ